MARASRSAAGGLSELAQQTPDPGIAFAGFATSRLPALSFKVSSGVQNWSV